jgi:hypothetical protein
VTGGLIFVAGTVMDVTGITGILRPGGRRATGTGIFPSPISCANSPNHFSPQKEMPISAAHSGLIPYPLLS